MIFKSYQVERDLELIDKDLILFYGENLGLQNEFKKLIRKKKRDSEIILLNQEDIIKNKEIFFNELFNDSLFQKEKIVFINETNDKIITILKEIETKINNRKIYLFSELLDKKSKLRLHFEKSPDHAIIPCYADNDINLKQIINEQLKSFKGLTSQNINLIISNCNSNRVKLYNELEKINLYFDNKVINSEKLENLLNLRVNDDFNNLKDEALKGNKIQTNRLISDTVMNNEKNILYLNIINQRLTKLNQICELNNEKNNIEKVVNDIKPPIFWKDKPTIIMQVKKWNKNKISDALKKTYNLEMSLKSNSSINHQVLIKKLVVDICEIANA
tara:strand:+ start:509 stop:1501 length:993 start_codon:yes stop_codon:yes gene_type:complete